MDPRKGIQRTIANASGRACSNQWRANDALIFWFHVECWNMHRTLVPTENLLHLRIQKPPLVMRNAQVEFRFSILWVTEPGPCARCMHIIAQTRIKVKVCQITSPADFHPEMMAVTPNFQQLAVFEHCCIDGGSSKTIGWWW